MADGGAKNTDRELWREKEGDYYSDSLHVTATGGIGMNVGGSVIVKPLRQWFALAVEREEIAKQISQVKQMIADLEQTK